jgi:hypothetical protein
MTARRPRLVLSRMKARAPSRAVPGGHGLATRYLHGLDQDVVDSHGVGHRASHHPLGTMPLAFQPWMFWYRALMHVLSAWS